MVEIVRVVPSGMMDIHSPLRVPEDFQGRVCLTVVASVKMYASGERDTLDRFITLFLPLS